MYIAGIGIAIPIGAGTGSVSGHLSNSKIDSQYASVGQQSGMLAGDGGFTVQVGGKTELTGAVIASTAQALEQGLNSFNSANGLMINDMQNQAAFSAHSMSASGGVGTLPAGNQGTAVGLGLAGENAQSVSQSGISGIAGNTSITSDAAQTGIAAIFNAQQVQQTINAQTQITAAFSQQAPQAVASYAQSQQTALREQAKNENDPVKRAELYSEADKWNEGGVNRAKLHLVTGALSGGIGGALGAGAAALAAPMLEQVQSSMAEQLTGAGLAPALANMAAQAIATGAAAGIGGAAGGGMAGAGMGLVVDANNRQLHPEERNWIKDNAARYASQSGISVDQAVQTLTAQADRQVQSGSAGEWDKHASVFLKEAHGLLPAEGNSGTGYMFYATPTQQANPEMYAQYGNTNTPSASAIAQAITHKEQALQQAGSQTLLAASVAGVVAGAGPIAMINGTPIFSTGGALGSSMWASPVGTAAISAGINAGAQYVQNGSINPVDVGVAAVTGGLGTYGGLLWNVGVNAAGGAGGALINNYLYGQNDSVLGNALASGIFSSVGYGLGQAGESLYTGAVRPTINTTNWAGTGTWSSGGWNLFSPNTTPVITGNFVGGLGQSAVESIQNKNTGGDKK